LGDVVDIAFMKLCYIDINNDTDVRELFEYYLKSLDSLQTKYPDLKIIHFTVPLTIKSKGIKGLAKVILKRDDNINRNKFNELMKNQFDQNELFDIAGIESTFPDGSSYRYVNGIPGLIPEYSSDGRHLNQDGKVLVARELVRKLLMND
jgi:hypothetical protein